MPELPEVETVRRALQKNILNHKIIKVEVMLPKMVGGDAETLINQMQGNSFVNIDRKGKWLILELKHGVLLSHLRMEGKYYYKGELEPKLKHEHVIFSFDNNMTLRYNDTRQFGTMKLFENKGECLAYLETRIGHEPWDHDAKSLKNQLHNKRIAIKSAILDQKIISGIGNIYADEILFLSRINPMLPASDVSSVKLNRLIVNAAAVLSKSIELGGTTIRNFESELGLTGHYQSKLLVHTKAGLPCPVCSTKIIKTKVNGRGTYYCPHCQR